MICNLCKCDLLRNTCLLSGVFYFRRTGILSHSSKDFCFNVPTRSDLTNIRRKIVLITASVTILYCISSIRTALFFHILSPVIWGMCLEIAGGLDGSQVLAERVSTPASIIHLGLPNLRPLQIICLIIFLNSHRHWQFRISENLFFLPPTYQIWDLWVLLFSLSLWWVYFLFISTEKGQTFGVPTLSKYPVRLLILKIFFFLNGYINNDISSTGWSLGFHEIQYWTR